MKTKTRLPLALAASLCLATAPAAAETLTISASLPQVHFWVGGYLDPFADGMEEETDVEFIRFYAGELVGVGRGLDALQGGTVDVVSPLLAPYHAGLFPLSDITQLPVYGTTSPAVTRAFQNLLDSDVELVEGKTFYDYEIGGKGIVAWGLGASGAYAISTTGKEVVEPADFEGLPLRAGAALQTMTLEQLGVNPVTMPAAQAFEALSRGTIDGILLSVADWKSYSFTDLLKYTIDGVALGHWESYHAISEDAWNRLSEEEREAFDRLARETALANAARIEAQKGEVEEAARKLGAEFVMIGDMSPRMQDHIATAARETWAQWIEETEANGHPARAAARLWAQLIQEEGGVLPEGVEALLQE